MNTRLKYIFALVAGALLLAGVASCGTTSGQKGSGTNSGTKEKNKVAAPQELRNVKIGVLKSVSDAGIFIAVAKGYFEQEGLKLELINFNTAANMISSLGTGQLDVGGGAPSAGLFNAFGRNIPIKIVADKGTISKGHGYQAILVRKDLQEQGAIKGYADFKGKKIALATMAGTAGITLDKALKMGGLTRKDVEIIEMPFSDRAVAFSNKAIDISVDIEPGVAAMVKQGLAVRWKTSDEINPDLQVAVLLYSPQFAENRKLAVSFMRAYLKGVKDYNAAFDQKDPGILAEVIDILSQSTSVKDKSLYKEMVMPGINPDGFANINDIKAQQTYYLNWGKVEKEVNIEKLVDNSFVKEALATLKQR